MSRLIFVNLPVTDLARSTAFYEAAGFRREPRFSDPTGACMTLSETIHVMLLAHAKWRQFTSKRIPDARESAQVLLCISAGSRAEVDEAVARAAGAGGSPDPVPVQDHGFMYGRSFEDPDGHVWEVMWMDMAAAERAMAQPA